MRGFKYIIVVLVVLQLVACGTSNSTKTTLPTSSAVVDVNDASVNLIGVIHREDLESAYPWFSEGYNNYSVDTKTMEAVKPYLEGVTVKVYMGTWCSDSQREVPNFFKIMDSVDFHNIQVFGLDEDKTSPDGLEKDYNVLNVPTFVFLKDGKEINRMVEFPWDTLEKDMLAIFTTEDYKDPYKE
ncbi:TlpA family protein disulfide reductase [Neptunitalea lumnitzerae]|uniref:Thioredoxin n=1 Tax=Neptunitalea lumnitzerae TaxID=2965509 RepID=A0ABQ5MLS1_9FLAO|nr:thioredoxin family protein [Neptunitalea sp. Y10]GLB50015.1 hypothetical protein Y10_23830 [Neptunitalea sp. Y10]